MFQRSFGCCSHVRLVHSDDHALQEAADAVDAHGSDAVSGAGRRPRGAAGGRSVAQRRGARPGDVAAPASGRRSAAGASLLPGLEHGPGLGRRRPLLHGRCALAAALQDHALPQPPLLHLGIVPTQTRRNSRSTSRSIGKRVPQKV